MAGVLEEEEIRTQGQKETKSCEDRRRVRSDAPINQGTPRIAGNHRGRRGQNTFSPGP